MAQNLFEKVYNHFKAYYNNGYNLLKKLRDVYFGGPQDVNLQWQDPETGQVHNLVVPSFAKMRDRFISDVNSTMAKTIYVDAENGSDETGDGSSSAPFKTLQKAVDSIPVGGVGFIRIVSDYTGTFTARFKTICITIPQNHIWTIPASQNCVISGSNVEIINKGRLIIEKSNDLSCVNYAAFIGSNFEDCGFAASNITNLYLINLSTENPIEIGKNRYLFGSRTCGTNQNIQLNLAIYNLYCKGNFIIDGMLMKLLNGPGSFQWNNYANDSTFKVVDSQGNSVDVKTKLSGVIKDSNGIPRNILSNIIL